METTEKYPDVTLAEHGPLNNVHGVDTVVMLRHSNNGCYLSRTRSAIIAAVILLVVAAVVLLVLFLGGRPDFGCNCNQVLLSNQTKTPHRTAQLEENKNNIQQCSGYRAPADKDDIRLPRAVIPIHYHLNLRVDLTNFLFWGAMNISLKVNTSTKVIVLHRADLTINKHHVKVWRLGGNRSSVEIRKQCHDRLNQFHIIELMETMPARELYVLEMGRFNGTIRPDLRGLYLSSYKDRDGNTRYLAASQLQSTDARRVFPCFDEPDFKATFKVTIEHEPGYQALNNMPAERTEVLPSGWIRREFQQTPVMSTYILAFFISDFTSRKYVFENGYVLQVWSQPDSYNQTEHAMEFGIITYNFFTDYFNLTDVVPKADHVAVPDFSAGAMENWGLVIYRETALLYDPEVSSSSNKYTVTLIVAHEIAHTWFGNMVTMKWWDDLWLNEGFASILMYLAMDYAYPEWNVFDLQVVEEMFPVMVKDALVSTHPVSVEILHPDHIPQIFGVISYNKGMAVLRMLQGFIGPEKFRKGLRIYVKRFQFGNADIDQLWQTFTEAVDNQLVIKQIMDTWILQKGFPVVNVTEVGDRLRLDQMRFLLDMESPDPDSANNTFNYKWYIPFTYTTESDSDSANLTWLNMDSQWIPKPTGWLLGNVNYTGYFRVNYERSMWIKLSDQLSKNHRVFQTANRAGLIGDAFALARANFLDYDIALSLTKYLQKEESYVPWRAFLDAIEFLRGMIATKSAFDTLQKYLLKLVVPVLDSVEVEDVGTLPERYLRRVVLSMACDLGVPKAVNHAMKLFRDWRINNTRLPPDMALLVYTVAVREGGQDTWDFIWDKAQATPIMSEKDMMMDALAQTEKPWLLWRYVNWLFDTSKIKLQDVRVIIKHLTNTPLGRIIVLDFLTSRWEELNDKFGQDPYLMREVINEVTEYVNTVFQMRQLENLFRDIPPKTASLATSSSLALIRANILWMNNHYDKIADWLDKNLT